MAFLSLDRHKPLVPARRISASLLIFGSVSPGSYISLREAGVTVPPSGFFLCTAHAARQLRDKLGNGLDGLGRGLALFIEAVLDGIDQRRAHHHGFRAGR